MKPTIYRVKNIGSGFLAVMAKPVAGEWIEDEFSGISKEGIEHVVSLLELTEAHEVGLGDEMSLCERNGMKFTSFPIPDRGLPLSISKFADFTRCLYRDITGGQNTVVHCRAGIGRTGLVAAGVLLHAAFEPEEAFAHISSVRGVTVPDTDEQYNWIIANLDNIIAR